MYQSAGGGIWPSRGVWIFVAVVMHPGRCIEVALATKLAEQYFSKFVLPATSVRHAGVVQIWPRDRIFVDPGPGTNMPHREFELYGGVLVWVSL